MATSREATTGQAAPLRVFISYARTDERTVRRLQVHLKQLATLGDVEFWDDRHIMAGDVWSRQVEDAIETSDVFLLCMSADYLGSNYINDRELPAIRRRVASPRGLVIPVILSPCLWYAFVPEVQAVPSTDGRVVPLSEWRPREHGYARATEQVRQAICAYRAGSVFVAPPDPRPRVAPPTQSALPGQSTRFGSDEVESLVKSLKARRSVSNG